MSPIRTVAWLVAVRRHLGIVVMVAALAAGIGLLVTANGTPDADAKPINPYVPCPQWQEMHPGWPCWGNFPEIEEPTAPTPLPPSLPSAPPSAPPAQPPAAALTPPAALPPPDPCVAIIAVPGYRPPALPGQPANAPCSSGAEPQRVPSPRELIEPFLNEACLGARPLDPSDIHEVVTSIVGPLEEEASKEGRNNPFVQRVINRANSENCTTTKDQLREQLWQEFKHEWYREYRERFLRKRKTECREDNKRSLDCEGLVAVCFKDKVPPTADHRHQRAEYIRLANEYLQAKRGPAIRISTTGSLRDRANKSAEKERARDPGKYAGLAVGHAPDTFWTGPEGNPEPFDWLPMDSQLNKAIGGQAAGYPVGYRALLFVPGDYDAADRCSPSVNPGASLGKLPVTLGGN